MPRARRPLRLPEASSLTQDPTALEAKELPKGTYSPISFFSREIEGKDRRDRKAAVKVPARGSDLF